jgi:hypothetical protein
MVSRRLSELCCRGRWRTSLQCAFETVGPPAHSPFFTFAGGAPLHLKTRVFQGICLADLRVWPAQSYAAGG